MHKTTKELLQKGTKHLKRQISVSRNTEELALAIRFKTLVKN